MRRFAPGFRMTVVCAALLPALVGLGFWQLERAAEAERHRNGYLERMGQPPVGAPATPEGNGFKRVRLEGEYLAGQDYFVDNRVQGGRPGYWVVTRFRGVDGRIYLVNRGWTPAPSSRDRLPDVLAPEGRVHPVGIIWPATGLPPLLAADRWTDTWPKRVQRLDVARMADQGEGVAPVVPMEVRLEPGQPGVLEPAPLVTNLHPERHYGYAVQWFVLAATLAAAFLVFGFRGSRP